MWFKELSGAKRIELMCGLMSMCIPLEIRFFKTFIDDIAKKDTNAFREADLKANSFTEIDSICKCDLLADIAITDSNDLKPNVTNCEMQSNPIQTNCSLNNAVNQSMPQPMPQSMPPPVVPVMPSMEMAGVAPNGTAVMPQTDMMVVPTPSPPNASANHLSQLPSRSKLIISLCLLSPTNRTCSAAAYKALCHQLTAPKIGSAVTRYLAYGKNIYELEDFFSGVRLLLTLALYHPAFSFDERERLAKQKDEVDRTIDTIINPHYRQNPNFTNAHQSHPYQGYGGHQTVHTVAQSHIHGHIGAHTTQPHTQSAGVSSGGPTPHSHSHSHVPGQMSGPVPHQAGQYGSHPSHPYMPPMVSNMSYTNPPLTANIANLRISSNPVSTPSPTSSPSSSKTATSVAAISPLPMGEFVGTHIHPMNDGLPNQSPYVLTTGIPTLPHQPLVEDRSCAKNVLSCYNCGSIGHRGDECTAQSQEEANR